MNCFEELTDMLHPEQITQEMNKKYKDTYLYLQLGDKNMYAMYHGSMDNNMQHLFKGRENKEWITIKLPLNHKDNVRISIPKFHGCYSTNTNLAIIQTLPHRQWKKGICRQNTDVYIPVDFHAGLDGNQFNNRFVEILEEDQTERTLDEAIKAIETNQNRIGTHITRDFGLLLNYGSTEDCYRLFFFGYLIGSVYPKTKTILIENNIFLQEILDTVRYWAPTYEVTTHG